MPNHIPLAIAREFARQRGTLPSLGQMQVQKLVYFAHGWTLAITNDALVNERPEAWDNGPVFRSIWNYVRDSGPIVPSRGNAERDAGVDLNLTGSERNVINHVWKRYGRMSGWDLSQMTHQDGTPWSKAYFGRGRNAQLSDVEIKQHYINLALAGRGLAD